jgi:hypothetical protein
MKSFTQRHNSAKEILCGSLWQKYFTQRRKGKPLWFYVVKKSRKDAKNVLCGFL